MTRNFLPQRESRSRSSRNLEREFNQIFKRLWVLMNFWVSVAVHCTCTHGQNFPFGFLGPGNLDPRLHTGSRFWAHSTCTQGQLPSKLRSAVAHAVKNPRNKSCSCTRFQKGRTVALRPQVTVKKPPMCSFSMCEPITTDKTTYVNCQSKSSKNHR